MLTRLDLIEAARKQKADTVQNLVKQYDAKLDTKDALASYRETLEKRSMGFQMSSWDNKLLKYGGLFEREMMSLEANIPLEKALDRGWEIMGECFTPEETGIKRSMIERFWGKS